MTPEKLQPETISLRTVCGIEELSGHAGRGFTHVLSLLDPGTPHPSAFSSYGEHRRTTLEFHDIIEPLPGMVAPSEAHVAEILRFGAELGSRDHLLIHCHMGISRSTAAMAMLLAQAEPELDEAAVIERLYGLRRQSWPNARMIAMADEQLGREGRLIEAVRGLHARQIQAKPEIETVMRALGRMAEVEAALAA